MISETFVPEHKSIIKIIQFSVFSDKLGPVSEYCYPKETSKEIQLNVAMKSISLMMGETVYQNGNYNDRLQSTGIIPFPDINMVGLSIFFLIKDENARGKAKASTISLLVEENDTDYLFNNMKSLKVILMEWARKFENNPNSEIIEELMDDFVSNILYYDITDPLINKYNKRYKFLFVGLDSVGKTAFLNVLKDKYSELMSLTPTKGVHRSERKILDTILVEWELGGQKSYRENYFKYADYYLTSIDILFYFFDIQDSSRINESLDYFDKIINSLEKFKEYPIIIIIFHKLDPELKENKIYKEIKNREEYYKEFIENKYKNWKFDHFETSIYDPWSIISAFSNALNKIHPSKISLRKYLEDLCKNINANSAIFLMRNCIILSDYTESSAIGKFLETSRYHFYNMYNKLENLNQIENNMFKCQINRLYIILKRFYIENIEYYLLMSFLKEPIVEDIEKYIEKFKNKIKI